MVVTIETPNLNDQIYLPGYLNNLPTRPLYTHRHKHIEHETYGHYGHTFIHANTTHIDTHICAHTERHRCTCTYMFTWTHTLFSQSPYSMCTEMHTDTHSVTHSGTCKGMWRWRHMLKHSELADKKALARKGGWNWRQREEGRVYPVESGHGQISLTESLKGSLQVEVKPTSDGTHL